MDPPVALGVETKPDKTDETNGSPKSYDCGLCDTEAVYKIAQELLPGLASSCVDNTTGGIFKNAASVAVDMRKEMADYLTQRSESYVSEVLLTENSSNEELSAHPYDIILSLIDDFSASKRNMFSRVSEWVLSDRREDRIDDFVQEMEINGFWLLARRECVASMLLKNVDYKNAFHCNMVCSSEHEVVDHRAECKFRPMDCTNEGCTTRYCAAQKENHEAICPFMVLPCEQKCLDFVMRREMDRHCVTVCPMKLVNCAFYTVGCESSIPRCNLQQHNVDGLLDHLLCILRTVHKEAGEEDLKRRAEQIRNLSNTEKLARARDARALTYLIKDAEKKLGTLGTSIEEKSVKDDTSPKKELSDEMESLTEKPTKEEAHQESPKSVETKEKVESPSSRSIESGVLRDEEEQKELAKKEPSDSEEEESEKSPKRETVEEKLSNTVEKESGKSPRKEESKELSSSDEEESKKSPKREEKKESSGSYEEESKKSPKKEEKRESSRSDEEESKKSTKKEERRESSRSDEEECKKSPKKEERRESKKSPKKEERRESSRSDEEESKKSPKKEERRESSRSDDEEEESKETPKKEEIKESLRSNEEESKKSPKKEERKESSSSDEEGFKKSPKKETVEEETAKPPKMEKTKELSNSDEEELTRSPLHIES